MANKKISGISLAVLFMFWYACNAGYNVYNSYCKKDYPFPYAIALTQLAVGIVYVVPQWILGMRDVPRLSLGDFITLFPIGKKVTS